MVVYVVSDLKVKGHTTCQRIRVLLMSPDLVLSLDIPHRLYSGRPSIKHGFFKAGVSPGNANARKLMASNNVLLEK